MPSHSATAFAGPERVASGDPSRVAAIVADRRGTGDDRPLPDFDDESGATVDLELQVIRRGAAHARGARAPRGRRGRPPGTGSGLPLHDGDRGRRAGLRGGVRRALRAERRGVRGADGDVAGGRARACLPARGARV